MSEHNSIHPSDNFNFDSADFGDPTQETLLAFAHAIELLKQLAASEEGGLTVLRLDDDPNPQVPKINGTLNNYLVSPNNDPIYKGPRFSASIYDADSEIMAQVQNELEYIISIHYSDEDKEVNYRQVYGEDPTLYIRTKHDRVGHETARTSLIESSLGGISLNIKGTPDFMRFIHARLEEKHEAHQQGLDKPTEGTMKTLIEIINAEFERRTAK